MDIFRHSYPAGVVLPIVQRAKGRDNCVLLTRYKIANNRGTLPLTEQKDSVKIDLRQFSQEDLYALAQSLLGVSRYLTSRGFKVHAKKSVDASLNSPLSRQTAVFPRKTQNL